MTVPVKPETHIDVSARRVRRYVTRAGNARKIVSTARGMASLTRVIAVSVSTGVSALVMLEVLYATLLGPV